MSDLKDDPQKAMGIVSTILRSAKRAATAKKFSNQKLADLLIDHVSVEFDMFGYEMSILDAVIDRLGYVYQDDDKEIEICPSHKPEETFDR